MEGKHNNLVALQTHIKESYYPYEEFKNLEPLERQKCYLNRRGIQLVSAGVPAAVSISGASTATSISTLETSLISMNKGIESLIKANNTNMRAISNLQRAVTKGNLDANLSDSEASSLLSDGSYDSHGIRRRLKSSKKKRKGSGNRDHSSLRQSGLPGRR